jgi:hypothetical protein
LTQYKSDPRAAKRDGLRPAMEDILDTPTLRNTRCPPRCTSIFRYIQTYISIPCDIGMSWSTESCVLHAAAERPCIFVLLRSVSDRLAIDRIIKTEHRRSLSMRAWRLQNKSQRRYARSARFADPPSA